MSASYTLASLKTAIIAEVEDDSTELSDSLDELIKRAESRLLKELELEFMDSDESITLTDGSQSVTKPSGIVTDVELWYTSSGRKYPLEKRSLSWLRDYWPTAASEGLPLFYAELSSTAWEVAPTPNATFTGTARCVKRPTSLTSSSPTWLSTNAADALFYSCLVEVEMFLKGDLEGDRAKKWADMYVAAVTSSLRELVGSVRSKYNPVQPAAAAAGSK